MIIMWEEGDLNKYIHQTWRVFVDDCFVKYLFIATHQYEPMFLSVVDSMIKPEFDSFFSRTLPLYHLYVGIGKPDELQNILTDSLTIPLALLICKWGLLNPGMNTIEII